MKSNPEFRSRTMLKEGLLLSEVSDAHQDMGNFEENEYFCQRAGGTSILIKALFILPGVNSNPLSQRVLGGYQCVWNQDCRILPGDISRRTTLLVHQFSHSFYRKFLVRHHFCLVLQCQK